MDFWTFQIPNMILAAAMYTLLGRFLLSLFFHPDSDRVLWRVFVQITDPFLKVARLVTPQLVGVHLLVLFAALWTLLARIGLFLTLAAIGLRPTVGA